MTSFLDELNQWTEFDAAVLALGRALGVFPPTTRVEEARALLATNGAVGSTLTGLLERLTWLGVLECDDEAQRYRSAPQRLHPLGAADDVPTLKAGPPRRAHIAMSIDPAGEFRLEANRVGFRFLARLFEEIANSGLQSGWQFRRDRAFMAGAGVHPFWFALSDPEVDDGNEP
jgi:hypothetical protein